MWVSHVAVDGVNNRMTSKWRHQKTEGDGEGEPVLWEEVCRGGLAEGAGCVGLHEAVEDDYADDWEGC